MNFSDRGVEFIEQQTVIRGADILAAEPQLTESGRSRWLPTSIRIIWQRNHKRGEAWGPWMTTGAAISGPRLKLDSTPRMGAPYTMHYVGEDDKDFGEWVKRTKPNPSL